MKAKISGEKSEQAGDFSNSSVKKTPIRSANIALDLHEAPRAKYAMDTKTPSRSKRPPMSLPAPAAKIIGEGITFDDVLLLPAYSEVIPTQADVRTRLTRHIRLNIPLVSAPMDTVTESGLAIALAQEGGIGFIHKNLPIEAQVREVEMVKRSANGVIEDPKTLRPDQPVQAARDLMETHNIAGVPITLEDGKLVGILTRRDLKFLRDFEQTIKSVMTCEHLITAPPNTSLEKAEEILKEARVEKLLLVDGAGRLAGLITMRDIDKSRQFPNSCKDQRGRLRVGAAASVHDYERIEALLKADVDVLVIDSAHGHSKNVIESIRSIRKKYAIDLVAGNVATAEGATALIKAGADAVKVGIGPGSICTTRVVSGVGVPQITAIMEAMRVAERADVPVISDGGVRHSGDITKALAAGAGSVMIGSLFAGLDESPGQVVLWKGRRFKDYRGMGSLGAMIAGSGDRYNQGGERRKDKLVPEGVEGRVPYRGRLVDFVYQMVGGLKSGMGYTGCQTIADLHTHARFLKISAASLTENHPHDILITRESPNYSTDMGDQG